MVKNRDVGIDLLKFLAVLFVVNSHMDMCYPGRWSLMATGGAIGDALFFFCSGYTLFMKDVDGFVPWYKKRLWRIAPTLLLCFGLACLLYGADFWQKTGDGFWFVRLILLFYILLYFVRKHLVAALIGACVVVAAWFLFFFDWSVSVFVYHPFMRAQYFLPMLIGAILGSRRADFLGKGKVFADFLMLVISVSSFFALKVITSKFVNLSCLQLVSIIVLNTMVYFLWKVVEFEGVNRFVSGWLRPIVLLIGGLCLEVYLSHRPFLTDALNGLFPFNVPLLFVAMLLLAYVVRCVTRFIVQTLQWQGHYDWRAIVKVV